MKKDNKTMLSSFEQFTSKNAKILWGVLAVILIALPFVVKNQYFLTVVAKIGCYAILGLGLNILTGYTGLVSLGHAGDVNHPEVTEAITRLIKKANAAGVCVGMTAFAAEDTGKWIDAGADFILVGCDILLYAEAVKAAVKTARGQMKGA